MKNYKEIAKSFAEDIISVSPTTWDDPNGPYIYSCPYCENSRENVQWADMQDINHRENCPYKKAIVFLHEIEESEE